MTVRDNSKLSELSQLNMSQYSFRGKCSYFKINSMTTDCHIKIIIDLLMFLFPLPAFSCVCFSCYVIWYPDSHFISNLYFHFKLISILNLKIKLLFIWENGKYSNFVMKVKEEKAEKNINFPHRRVFVSFESTYIVSCVPQRWLFKNEN